MKIGLDGSSQTQVAIDSQKQSKLVDAAQQFELRCFRSFSSHCNMVRTTGELMRRATIRQVIL